MAKVCDGCYGELKKRGGDIPGLMRGTGDHPPFLPHVASPSHLPGEALNKSSPQGGNHFRKRWFCRKCIGAPRGRVPWTAKFGKRWVHASVARTVGRRSRLLCVAALSAGLCSVGPFCSKDDEMESRGVMVAEGLRVLQ